MRIGELAAQAGVNPKTIRFYERQGLMPNPSRLDSGYRDYGADDGARLVFIKTAQRLSFSLSEIAEILALKERGQRPCDYVLSVLDRQVGGIDRRLGELVALRAELVALKTMADDLGPGGECYCSIIEHARGAVPPPGGGGDPGLRRRRAPASRSRQPISRGPRGPGPGPPHGGARAGTGAPPAAPLSPRRPPSPTAWLSPASRRRRRRPPEARSGSRRR